MAVFQRHATGLATLAALLFCAGGSLGQGPAPAQKTLHIGTSGSLAPGRSQMEEEAALSTLRSFIKSETGLDNEIARQKTWRDLADRMAKSEFQVGVFQGFELGWAQKDFPALQPLAIAVNVYRYPEVYVVAKQDDAAKNIAGLQGQSLAMPATSLSYIRLYVDRQIQQAGKDPKSFFARTTAPKSDEDAIDDVVDGVVQATAVDRVALEAYRRRKPFRFKKLKAIAHSEPLPPPVVAYYHNGISSATRDRFKKGLLTANQKEKGQTLLTFFRLTAFEAVPADFAKVLEETRKNYPPPNGAAK